LNHDVERNKTKRTTKCEKTWERLKNRGFCGIIKKKEKGDEKC
jgi:hypothetical protein